MAAGRVVESGNCLDVLRNPAHEVTRAIVTAYEPVTSGAL
jgi:ABC-type antimicrobial peptide transport system ATPase subunit